MIPTSSKRAANFEQKSSRFYIFRRDQIYFTDINPDCHRTMLYPLSSLPCRKDENIQKKYLESKYCKVPFADWNE